MKPVVVKTREELHALYQASTPQELRGLLQIVQFVLESHERHVEISQGEAKVHWEALVEQDKLEIEVIEARLALLALIGK